MKRSVLVLTLIVAAFSMLAFTNFKNESESTMLTTGVEGIVYANTTPQAGATVLLYLGTIPLGSATTNASGYYNIQTTQFVGVGDYTVIASYCINNKAWWYGSTDFHYPNSTVTANIYTSYRGTCQE